MSYRRGNWDLEKIFTDVANLGRVTRGRQEESIIYVEDACQHLCQCKHKLTDCEIDLLFLLPTRCGWTHVGKRLTFVYLFRFVGRQ